MSKQALLLALLLVGLLLFCCCTASQKQREQQTATLEPEGKQQVSIAELRQLYEAAQSQYERRAVCLRAIDEGIIHRGGPISSIDEIFGTHFASDLPTKDEELRKALIAFIPLVPSRDETRAAGSGGWYMAVDYHFNGAIQNYYLTNLHKGNLSSVLDKQTVSTTELKRLYETAQSEFERRAVCLRAIDKGTIQTYQPVTPIDEIFGTRFASELPTRKEKVKKASIDFVPAVPRRDESKATPNTGWFMEIEYDNSGTLMSYYLTNLRQ